MKSKKFITVEQETPSGSTVPWLIDVNTVSRMMPDSSFVMFDDGAAMNLTQESARRLIEELEVQPCAR